jgi:hypothetical protein
MRLRFDADGGVEGEVLTRLDAPDDRDSPSNQIVSDYRRQVDEGRDPWVQNIGALRPSRERLVYEREHGELVRVERRFKLDSAEQLGRLFEGDAARVGVAVEGRSLSLSIVPVGSRADSGDNRRVDAARAELLRLTQACFETTGDLFRWVEFRPERRRAVLGTAFATLLSEQDEQHVEALRQDASEEEDRLVEAFDQANDELADFLFDEQQGRLALESVSRAALSPLRARLLIQVEGAITDWRGFEPPTAGRDGFELPEGSFLQALRRTAREIVDPFPLAEAILHARAAEPEPTPLEELTAWALIANPVPPDLAQRLEAALKPAPEYYLAWTLPEPAD